MTRHRQRTDTPDSGASLLLAIAFVLMVGAISGGLVGLAATSLRNRATLQLLRDREYAADGAIERAIADARPGTCSSNASFVDATTNGIAIRVEWTSACGVVQGGNRGSAATAAGSDGTVVAQRNVVLSACADTGAACAAGAVIIRAVVNFEQVQGGAVTRTYVQSWSVNR